MTSFTRKLYRISPRAAEDFHNAQKFEHRVQYGKHVTLACFTPDPHFGARKELPVLPAFECSSFSQGGKPKQVVRAADSFEARKQYAAYHQIAIEKVDARLMLPPR